MDRKTHTHHLRKTTNPAVLAALQRQATAYARLFQLFDKYPGTIERVTLWGINDRRSWRSGQRPLLFDGQMQPKPAYQAVLDVATHRGDPSFLADGADPYAPAKSGEADLPPLPTTLPIRIKAGMAQPFKDSKGVVWAADTAFDSGQPMDRTGSLQITSTDRPELFTSKRLFNAGTGAYHLKVPNGPCVVKLYFSEDYDGNTSPDARKFTYAVKDGDANGKVAREVKDFSPWAAAGGPAKAAYIDLHPTHRHHRPDYDFIFPAQAEYPQINALEDRRNPRVWQCPPATWLSVGGGGLNGPVRPMTQWRDLHATQVSPAFGKTAVVVEQTTTSPEIP